MLNGLDLFSGIGGLGLALEPWVRPISYCENDRYAQSVLLSRMRCGQLSKAPIWDDVRTLRGDSLGNWVDIIYGGFPCQDISVAGGGQGLAGKRSGLYWEVHRLISELKPTFVFLENVPAIRTRGLADLVRSLSDLGYDCRWTVVSAAEIGAVHIRKRWFLLAHSNGIRCKRWTIAAKANADKRGEALHKDWWKVEPSLDRVADGVPLRVDRVRGLGNAVVPAQAREAFKKLIGF